MAPKKLSPTQESLLEAMRLHGGTLIRMPGGFWTYPDCPTKDGREDSIPLLYWGYQSVRSLVRDGWLVIVEHGEFNYPCKVTLAPKASR